MIFPAVRNTCLAMTIVIPMLMPSHLLAADKASKAPSHETAKQYKLITRAPIRSLPLYEIQDTSALSDQAIIASSGPSHSYLLTLKEACPGLMQHEAILITNTVGSVEAGFDQVIVGPERQRCLIDKIYPLASQKDIDKAKAREKAAAAAK